MDLRSIFATLIIAMIALSATPLLADSEGSSEGKFTLQNSAPGVPYFELYQEDETTTTDIMTPQVEYALKITAQDPNGVDDIAKIEVHIYWGENNDGSDEPPSTPSAQDYAKYVWTKDNGWQLEGPTDSTWGIDTQQSRGPETSEGVTTSGIWWLHFIPGKVARAGGNWYIKVVVYDTAGDSNSNKVWGKTMNWYGEIAVLDTSFDFGSVTLGDTDVALAQPTDGYLDIYVVSNGDYKIMVKATGPDGNSDSWVGQNTQKQAQVVLSDPGAGQIRLKIDDDSDHSSGVIAISPQSYGDWITGTGPTSDGDASNGEGAHHTAYLLLDVGSEGLLPDTYVGKVYFQVIQAS